MSRSQVDEFQRLPAAILTDGMLVAPLFAVSRMTLSETYKLPAIGSSGFRAVVENSEDTVDISALLVGPQRFLWQHDLELLADFSRRGGALARLTRGAVGGIALICGLVTRTDMQITKLSFTVSAQRLDTLEVSLSLVHVPRPGPLNLLIDSGRVAAMTVAEFLT